MVGAVGRDKGGQSRADVPNDLTPLLSHTVMCEKSLEMSQKYLKGTLQGQQRELGMISAHVALFESTGL